MWDILGGVILPLRLPLCILRFSTLCFLSKLKHRFTGEALLTEHLPDEILTDFSSLSSLEEAWEGVVSFSPVSLTGGTLVSKAASLAVTLPSVSAGLLRPQEASLLCLSVSSQKRHVLLPPMGTLRSAHCLARPPGLPPPHRGTVSPQPCACIVVRHRSVL